MSDTIKFTPSPAFTRVAQALDLDGQPFRFNQLWSDIGNRFYHRLLWQQLAWNHKHSQNAAAAKVARKLLRFNPIDNIGARDVLPFLLLEQADLTAAKRSLKALADEPGLTAAATPARQRPCCTHGL